MVATLDDNGIYDFTLIDNGTPKIMRFAIGPHAHLVQMPTSVLKRITIYLALPYFGCEHWTKAVPSKSDCLIANSFAALMQVVFNIAK